jgi:DNA-binding NarL/FixJ family response regulator
MVDISTPLEPAAREAVEPLRAEHPAGSSATAPSSGDPGTGHRLVLERSARPGGRGSVISVVVVDDHAAVRLGLSVAISSRPGLVCVGAVPDGELLPALLYRVRPDVVVLDYELPRVNGLELCRRIKADVPAPAVVLYSAYAGEALTVPALVAGVDAMVHKGTPARELFTAIEAVAAGEKRLAVPVPELFHAAAGAIDAADRPLLELLLRQAPRPEISTRLALSAAELTARVHRILERLARRADERTSGYA